MWTACSCFVHTYLRVVGREGVDEKTGTIILSGTTYKYKDYRRLLGLLTTKKYRARARGCYYCYLGHVRPVSCYSVDHCYAPRRLVVDHAQSFWHHEQDAQRSATRPSVLCAAAAPPAVCPP